MMMSSTGMHIKQKPFAVWSLVLSVSCFVALVVFFGREPVVETKRLATVLISVFFSAVFGTALAFVVCGVTETVRALKARKLSRGDVWEAVIFLVLLALVFVVDFVFNVTIMRTIIWIILLAFIAGWAVNMIRRMVRRAAGRT